MGRESSIPAARTNDHGRAGGFSLFRQKRSQGRAVIFAVSEGSGRLAWPEGKRFTRLTDSGPHHAETSREQKEEIFHEKPWPMGGRTRILVRLSALKGKGNPC